MTTETTEAQEVIAVDMKKVDPKLVTAALGKYNLKKTGSPLEKVNRLSEHFDKVLNQEKDLFECDNCGGKMTDEWKECPFCGTAEEVDTGEEEEESEEEGAEASEEEKTNGAAKKKASKVLAEEELPKALAKYTAKDLDGQVKEILTVKTNAAVCMWELGGLILKNYKSEMWKLRRNEDNSARYRNVNAFWLEELGFSHTYCYQLMDVATNFTKQDVKQVGTTKLALILRAPEAARKKILDKARSGGTKGEIEAEVKKAQDRERGGDPAPTPPRHRRLTVITVPGKKTVKLFKAGAGDDGDHERATKLADLPWGELEFENSTQVSVKIAEKNGELVAILDFMRIKT